MKRKYVSKKELLSHLSQEIGKRLGNTDYGCQHCRENVLKIEEGFDYGKQIIIHLNPDRNAFDRCMGYHIGFVELKDYPLF